MKKRLSSGFALKGPREDLLDLDDNDDESEKRHRLEERQLAAAIESDSPGTPTKQSKQKIVETSAAGLMLPPKNAVPKKTSSVAPSTPSKGGIGSKISTEKLIDLYSNCIKLSTENKINQKNSWSLNLIDYIDDVLEQQYQTGDGTGIANFQAASCTLDASIKIYSYRVDSVHNDAYKVLGGLNRTDAKAPDDERPIVEDDDNNNNNIDGDGAAVDGDGNGDGDGAAAATGDPAAAGAGKQKKEKARKIPVGGINTLESNLDNINVKRFDSEFSEDPIFRKTSAAFDEGGARGLLLNHLHVHHACELIFDSTDAATADYPSFDGEGVDYSLDTPIQLKPLLGAVSASNVQKLELCPTMAGFDFAETRAERVVEEPDELPEQALFGGDDDDVDAAGDGFADDVAAQEANLIEAIREGVIDEGDEGAAPPPAAAAAALVAPGPPNRDNQALGNSIMLAPPNEFQYFDAKVAQNWAGPNHWKFRPPAPNKAGGANSNADAAAGDEDKENKLEETTGKKGRGKKKAPFFIDFTAPPEIDLSKALAVPSGKATTTLSASTLEKADASTTLPTDVHYDVKSLAKLFLKSQWVVPLKHRDKRPRVMQMDPATGAYQYENPNDSRNFVPESDGAVGGAALAGLHDDDDDDDSPMGGGVADFGGGDDDDGPESAPVPAAVPGPDGKLLEQPYRVEKVHINYAKTAKRVDVKALKESLWRKISEPTGAKDNGKEKRDTVPFQSVLAELPKAMPKEGLADVSVPFAFICLLHLANEHNLELTTNGLQQLTISRGK